MADTSDTPVSKLTKRTATAELKRLAEAIRAADTATYQGYAPALTEADYDELRKRLIATEEKFPELKHADSPGDAVAADFITSIRRFLNLKADDEMALTAEPKMDALIGRTSHGATLSVVNG